MGRSAAKRVFLVVLCALLGTVWLAGVHTAQAAPSYTISTQPGDLSKVRDGDVVKLSVAGLPAGASVEAALCPKNLRDNLIRDRRPEARFGMYCRPVPGAQSLSRSLPITGGQPRNGATHTVDIDYPVTRGETEAGYIVDDPDYRDVYVDEHGNVVHVPNPKKYSYRCDEANPCAIWLKIIVRNADRPAEVTLDGSLVVAPGENTGLPPGCQDPVAGAAVTTALPERMAKSASSWNSLLCSPRSAPSVVQSLASREGEVLAGFDKGERDLAFTGSGTALSADKRRDRVFVPTALNAVVLASVGRQDAGADDSGMPFVGPIRESFKFSLDDLADLVSKRTRMDGYSEGAVMADESALVNRNPVLAAMRPNLRLVNEFGLSGLAGPDTGPLFLSDLLTTSASGHWQFQPGEEQPVPVGRVTSYLQLNAGMGAQVNINTAATRSDLREQLDGLSQGLCPENLPCAGYVLTDLATATEFGWTPVSLPNASGEYVAPTPASLAAGAAHLVDAGDGTLRPGSTGTDRGAYPLTFAEYAVAPVNPLVDGPCKPRTAAQQGLSAMVSTAVGSGGQGALGPGLAPLPGSLAAVAKDRLAKIGSGSVADACREKEELKNPPSAPGAGGPGGDSGAVPPPGGLAGPSAASGAGTGAANGQATGAPAQAPTPASVQAAKNLAASVSIPPFPGSGVLGPLIPLLALVLLTILPSATAYLAAGRPVPPWLARTVRRLGGVFGRIGDRVRGGRFVPAGGGA
ncbi:hypothetical protein [Amycolatopsis minnesotensis]|uniref:Uncharacterized protein n=1 Tax=Amycolatopsis minnesotensis TaxID=337894 RepID=A0ABN2RFR0_9PSEU